MVYQLYLNKDNRIYNKLNNSEVLLWDDAGRNADSVLDSKLTKGATEILGYKCDELILTCKSGVQKYYFSPALKADAKLFANHKYGNWNEYLSRTNALPLKMIIQNEKIDMESVATEVKAMKLEEAEFQLPANAITTENPH